MPQAVVDVLEPIQVEEQHPEDPLGVAAVLAQGLLEPVQEQRTVREPGQGVVERIVEQLLFGQLACRDVRQRAGEPIGDARGVAHRKAAGQHPTDLTGAVEHPMLALEMGRPALQVLGQCGAQPLQVLRVDPVEPLVHPVPHLGLAIPEDGLPAGREIDGVAREVPIPQPVVGAVHCEGVALLACAQRLFGPLTLHRVPDGASQGPLVHFTLDQVVLGAHAHRARRNGLVLDVREDDEGSRGGNRMQLLEAREPHAVRQIQVEKDQVHATGTQVRDCQGQPLDVGDGERARTLPPEHVPNQVRLCRAVFHQQNPDRTPGGVGALGRHEGSASSLPGAGTCLGIVKKNVAPSPGVECTQISPPWRSTIRLHRARPTPVPGYSSAVCRR